MRTIITAALALLLITVPVGSGLAARANAAESLFSQPSSPLPAAAHAQTAVGPTPEFQGHLQLETEHTRIIYEPHAAAAALEVAGFADEVFLQVSGLLGYAPPERVPVVITDRTALANGFYSPLPHRITLFVTSPADRFLGSRTESWLRTLYTHELVHYIHLTERIGMPGLLSHVFGHDLTAANVVLMPLWWIEGIAVYAETALEPGGRGDSPLFALRYRAPLVADRMWHRHQLRYASAFPPPDRAYIGGYLLVNYLVERFGEPVIRDINQRFVRFPLGGIGPAIYSVTGESFADLYAGMVDSLAADEPAGSGAIGSPGGERILPHTVGLVQLPFSTRQGAFGYVRSQNSAGEWVEYDIQDGEFHPVRRFPIGRLSDELSISAAPDGKHAVFAQVVHNLSHPAGQTMTPVGYSDIYLLDHSDGSVRQLTHGRRLYQPAIGGDVVVALEMVGQFYRLVQIDPASGEVEPLYQPPGGSLYEPQVSADGDQVLAVRIVGGQSSLVRVDMATRDVEKLLPAGPAGIYRPRFGHDDSVIFSSDRSGRLQLYRIRLDDDTPTVELLLQDVLGVIGGQYHQGYLLYGSYRVEGSTATALPVDRVAAVQVAWLPSGADNRPDSLHTPVSPDHPGNPGRLDIPGNPAEAPPGEYLPAGDLPHRDLQDTARQYRDLPRPGFWLPLPRLYTDGNDTIGMAPGMFWLLQSVLGRHSLQGTLDYHLADAELSIGVEYRQFRAWGSAGISAASRYLQSSGAEQSDELQWLRQNTVGAQVSRVVWSRRRLNWNYAVQGGLAAAYTGYPGGELPQSLAALGRLQYAAAEQAPPAAFFGLRRAGLHAGMRTEAPLDGGQQLRVLPSAGGLIQLPVPWGFQVVRLELDAMFTSYGSLSGALLPRGEPQWESLSAPAKLRGGIWYRLPLGLYDRWIPYGGLAGAGASLFVQSAWYLDSPSQLAWEERLYAGGELALDLRMLLSVGVRPALGVVFRVDPARGGIDPGEDVHLYLDLVL
ncbi:TolB family protein [Spirochaeta africana]|uniref:Periplasmic component of the Tol biopolymer transport system n=1 Tax=Spirochaeta africana (strain ATCC 700263 / DSM 8902 / Z-7692) TaxID=889378 RepID=H9UFM1_SPIAZ|nr:hypothetical protein [Spirochaeta africana]AFG36314.1 hypothetical protein Spiaf_0205 [Spirochaeta africana DSM 8902]